MELHTCSEKKEAGGQVRRDYSAGGSFDSVPGLLVQHVEIYRCLPLESENNLAAAPACAKILEVLARLPGRDTW